MAKSAVANPKLSSWSVIKPPPREENPYDWMTRWALILLVALVLSRTVLAEYLRDPVEPMPKAEPSAAHIWRSQGVLPDSPPTVSYPGPGTSLLLDLLACVPAMIVLARRVVDRRYVLRWSAVHVLMGLLCLWMLMSALWASDRYATLVSASHFVCASVVLWTMSQLVRSWMRLRLIAAVCVGLLLTYFAYSVQYQLIDVPDMQRNWPMQKEAFLQQQGWEPDSYHAKQFEKRLQSGELFGFNASPNTFGAMLAMLTLVAMSYSIQRMTERKPEDWSFIVVLVVVLGTGWVIWQTKSRAGLVTPVLGLGVLGVVWATRNTLAQMKGRVFIAVIAAALAGIAVVIWHGFTYENLVHPSLTFRWEYWVGAARVFERNVLSGIGWDNFGLMYPQLRLPWAPEEVRDPHNFLIRFYVELGIIGGFLATAWVLRLWWELTEPVTPPSIASTPEQLALSRMSGQRLQPNALLWISVVGGLFFVTSSVAGIDWEQEAAYVIYELIKRLLYLCAFVLGASLLAIRSVAEPEADDRPAPWVLYGLLVGLAVFLVHNLIDFSLFETGPMFLFMMLAGSVLGVRQPTAASTEASGAQAGGPGLWILLGGTIAVWLAALLMFWLPTLLAERAAFEASELIRAGRLEPAIPRLVDAQQYQPFNSQYSYRAARMMIALGAPPDRTRHMLAQAIDINPLDVQQYLTRALFEMGQNDNEAAKPGRVRADFDRIVVLNPNDMRLRLAYAEALEKLGDLRDLQMARVQYASALLLNDRMAKDEPKRMPPLKVREIQDRISNLEKEIESRSENPRERERG